MNTREQSDNLENSDDAPVRAELISELRAITGDRNKKPDSYGRKEYSAEELVQEIEGKTRIGNLLVAMRKGLQKRWNV